MEAVSTRYLQQQANIIHGEIARFTMPSLGRLRSKKKSRSVNFSGLWRKQCNFTNNKCHFFQKDFSPLCITTRRSHHIDIRGYCCVGMSLLLSLWIIQDLSQAKGTICCCTSNYQFCYFTVLQMYTVLLPNCAFSFRKQQCTTPNHT